MLQVIPDEKPAVRGGRKQFTYLPAIRLFDRFETGAVGKAKKNPFFVFTIIVYDEKTSQKSPLPIIRESISHLISVVLIYSRSRTMHLNARLNKIMFYRFIGYVV